MNQTTFQFGDFSLDVVAGVLRHGDRPIELRPQTYAVLEYLVRHAGELVTREDLLAAVWGDRVVTDDSVTQCIGEIRSALGDSEHRLLKTLPRRGYRLQAKVTDGHGAETAPNAAGDRSYMSVRVVLLAVAGFVMVMALVLMFRARPGGPGDTLKSERPDIPATVAGLEGVGAGADATLETRPSLAVLPFDVRGDDEDIEVVADGLHDDLLTELAQAEDLRVISRTSVLSYRDSDQPLPTIAQDLGVSHVLEGSVELTGTRIRVIAQLIEAASDSHIWAETFDRERAPEHLFELRSELSRAIAKALHARLDTDTRPPTDSIDALAEFQRGRQLVARGGSRQLSQAIEHYERAVSLDPDFAEAWVGLANALAYLTEAGALPPQEAFSRRKQAIESALALDPDLPGAHAARAQMLYHRVGGGDVDAAAGSEAAFQRAIALNPNDARARMGYALLLNLAYPDRIGEALDLLQQARRLDPRSDKVVTNLAATYRFRGLFDPAERALLDVLQWNPNNPAVHRVLGRLYLDWGRLAAARSQAEESVSDDPGGVANWALIGETSRELRDEARSRETLEQLRRLAPAHPDTLVLEVQLLAQADDHESVVARFDEALERYGPEPGMVAFAVFTYLTLGDLERATEWQDLLAFTEDETRWPALIRREATWACVVGWMLTQSDRPALGARLVSAARHYLLEVLPDSRDHVDRYRPDICHLAAGEPGPALDAIELQVAHGHIAGWDDWHRLPLYEPILDDPRYRESGERRDAILQEERRLAGLAENEAAKSP